MASQSGSMGTGVRKKPRVLPACGLTSHMAQWVRVQEPTMRVSPGPMRRLRSFRPHTSGARKGNRTIGVYGDRDYGKVETPA